MTLSSVSVLNPEQKVCLPIQRETGVWHIATIPSTNVRETIEAEVEERLGRQSYIEVTPSPKNGGQDVSAVAVTSLRTTYAWVTMDGNTCATVQPVETVRFGHARHVLPPSLRVLPATKRFLTEDVREHVNRLIAMLWVRTQLACIPVVSLTLRVRTYPEEKYEELVLELSVQASAEQALAFWDSLLIPLHRWEKFIPANLREKLTSLITVSVIWS